MSFIPMEWEYTENPNENDIKLMEIKIYNRVVPQECFNRSRYCTIKQEDQKLRQKYFERYNGFNEKKEQILRRLAIEWLNKPYCWICYEKETNYKKCIIEHLHDINKPSIYSTNTNNYAGRFRSKACKHCNSIESQAKNINNITDRFKYWSYKKNWITQEEKEFYYIRLQ